MTNERPQPSAIEVLERAISKLETLRDEAWAAPWEAHHRTELDWLSKQCAGEGHQPGSVIVSTDFPSEPFVCTLWPHRNGKANTELIVALSRSVKPLIAMHRRSLLTMKAAIGSGMSEADVNEIAERSGELDVARAILGEENDHAD